MITEAPYSSLSQAGLLPSCCLLVIPPPHARSLLDRQQIDHVLVIQLINKFQKTFDETDAKAEFGIDNASHGQHVAPHQAAARQFFDGFSGRSESAVA